MENKWYDRIYQGIKFLVLGVEEWIRVACAAAAAVAAVAAVDAVDAVAAVAAAIRLLGHGEKTPKRALNNTVT